MNGTTYSDGFLDLVGGAQALFGSSAIVSTYHHADWLGSKRLATGTTRNVTLNVAYAPYAETYANSVGTDFNFTGIDNDSFTDLYDFPAREYHPTQGRWISPDPAGLGAVDMTNPQSWNRYAYVMNRALNLIDPFGLDPCDGILNCVSVTATAPGPGTDQSDRGGDFNDSDATSFVSTGSSGCSINFGGLFSYSTLTPCLSGGGRQWDRGFRHFRLRRRSPAANNGRMPNTITDSGLGPP